MRQQVRLYNAEGITGRNGVRDGWAGKKKLINQINAAARAEAKDIVTKLVAQGDFTPDNRQAADMLEAAIAIVAAEKHTPENLPTPLYDAKERIACMKLVLDFVQKRPITKSEVGLTKAEDFLAALVTKE